MFRSRSAHEIEKGAVSGFYATMALGADVSNDNGGTVTLGTSFDSDSEGFHAVSGFFPHSPVTKSTKRTSGPPPFAIEPIP